MNKKKESKEERAFHVGIREVHVSTRKVMARSAQEAIDKLKDGDGDEVMCEYSHTLDPELWTVEEV